jgi:hypothetical protein
MPKEQLKRRTSNARILVSGRVCMCVCVRVCVCVCVCVRVCVYFHCFV